MQALPSKDKQYIVTFKMTAVVLDKPNEVSKASEEPLVKFKKDSTLEQFLLTKTGDANKTCMEILNILKNVIKKEKCMIPEIHLLFSVLKNWKRYSIARHFVFMT